MKLQGGDESYQQYGGEECERACVGVLVRRKGVDLGRRPDDGKRPPPERFGLLVDGQLALVDEENVLHQPADLVDQMGRHYDRAGLLRVIFKQPVVKQAPGYGVQAQVRFVEDGQGRGWRGLR
jgi:hypothetical protein